MRSPIEEYLVHPLIFESGSALAYGPGLDPAGLMVARANTCTSESYVRELSSISSACKTLPSM